MISVVIPIFNTANYLRKCLDSVVNQTYSDLEIILINDGSTDDSERICLEYAAKDNRILYVRKKNEGQGVARNLALHMANGDFFTAIDSDDWWELSFCEKMLSTAQQFDADITICDFMNVGMEFGDLISQIPSRIRIRPNSVHCASTEPDLLNTCRTVFCCKLYKTEFLRTSDVFQPDHAYEDMAVTPLLSILANRIVRVPELLYFYLRSRVDSTTNLLSTKPRLRDALSLLVSRFRERKLFEPYRRELLKKNHSDVRFVISKMPEPAQNEDQRKIQSDLCQFLSSTYPEWVNVEQHRFTVIGSERLQTAVKRFLFHPERAQCFSNLATATTAHALLADYIFTDQKESLEGIPNLPKESSLFLIGDTSSYNNHTFVCRVVRLELNVDAEDEDCACWDLSDAIFYNL